MAPYEELYGRRCRSPIAWEEVGDRKIFSPELVEKAFEKVKLICDRLRTAQSRQKSYADIRRRALEFHIGDKVFLKVSYSKGIMRFSKKRKFSPQYIGPFEILEKMGDMAYRLALLPQLSRVHNVFLVSMLQKYQLDP